MNKYGLLIRNLDLEVDSRFQEKDIFSNCTQVQCLQSRIWSRAYESHAYLLYLVQLNQWTLKTIVHWHHGPPLLKELLLSIFDCPNLEILELKSFELDQETAEHLMHLSRLKKLVLHDIRFLETVRWSDNTSFPSVDYLSVDFTGDDWEFELIARCPNLTTLVLGSSSPGDLLKRSDIAKGQPWACLGLEIFSAWIKFDELDVNQGTFLESRHAVYTQLSRLSRLRTKD
ncbi:hypothetical protein BGZ88_003053 [Linnemannia elongata]|nr:hypothetical protein BGZ88_003053 [Linnemannia elongata]